MSILGKPTDQDFDQYPHVLLTSPHEWDSSVLNYSHPNTCGYPSWAPEPSVRDQHDPRIDECGNINHRTVHMLSILSDTTTILVKKHDLQPTTIDYNKLKPYFGWVNVETIKKTFENSTQWAVTSTRFPMRKHFESRFPAFNIPCRNEAVATNSIFSYTPVIDSGVTMAQFLLVKTLWSLMCIPWIHPSNLLILWKTMSKLISDYAQVEISNKVKDILRAVVGILNLISRIRILQNCIAERPKHG